MYGHGAVPPPRSGGKVISLRVMFAAAGALTCGLLSCLPLFRVAFVRGRGLDWLTAWLSLPLSITGFVVVGELPEEDWRSDLALSLLLLLGVASAVYYLVVDIRLHQDQRFAGFAHTHAPTHAPPGPYGFGHAAPPYTTPVPAPQHPVPPAHPTPVPQPHTRIPGPSHTGTVPPVPVPPAEPPQRPAPARIDQVRAELDELSDYLRRHDGHEGHGEGGR
ncbi:MULTISPECIES: hypothetical protein [Streptomyces]|uniref:Integral membrane protein n=1 Tax=Streptomyces flaveolus TaxID=67297 RepID=A0ABV3ADS6_9ACTN|nr:MULTISPECIES: hypothetical protein [Streptomyces]KMS88537.1 membrane protein [Streptomyces regensis]KOG58469.1 membrane protein [Streptomyces antibioticus]